MKINEQPIPAYIEMLTNEVDDLVGTLRTIYRYDKRIESLSEQQPPGDDVVRLTDSPSPRGGGSGLSFEAPRVGVICGLVDERARVARTVRSAIVALRLRLEQAAKAIGEGLSA